MAPGAGVMAGTSPAPATRRGEQEIPDRRFNPEQREAVLERRGRLLVLAGAGSGKTSVIIEKIRYLVLVDGVSPRNILAITFTNKAANEMKRRLADCEISGAWVSTFHAMCTRILRSEASHLGLSEQFNIYDEEDQLSVVKAVLRELNLDPKEFLPKDNAAYISRLKSEGLGPEHAAAGAAGFREQRMADVFARYEKALRTNQALDFDDLLLKALELFEKHPAVRAAYQERFRHVLVDEYQDTNRIQGRLTRHVAGGAEGLTVVGDPDQSIYSWRGADINNILNFPDEFAPARRINLERNYRSTRRILDLSNQLIVKNVKRFDKKLVTDKEAGPMPLLHFVEDPHTEAAAIASVIERLGKEGRALGKVAVFYRTNAQSRSIEEELRGRGIAYEIVGNVSFFARTEIKDLVSYLRFIHNPKDGVSLMRIINKPARGISETTKEHILRRAEERGTCCWLAMLEAEALTGLPPRAKESVDRFCKLMASLFADAFSSPDRLVDRLVETTGLLEAYRGKGGDEEDRAENIQEFMNMVGQFCEEHHGATLSQFLENVALTGERKEQVGEGNEGERVMLMTLHAAKGLEFDTVFLAGLEEGLLPHQRNLDGPGLEEERRLCYVGITRAERELHLYCSQLRHTGAKLNVVDPSRFLAEMQGPNLIIERVGSKRRAARPADAERELGPLKRGLPVRHEEYGKGVVLSVDDIGTEEPTARVYFKNGGEMSFPVQGSGLKPLG